ncbi:unnamed protein product [Trichogramma brassicae]|uniref:F-box domain-containing protein n=2 Tax=Trichogramma TaxID=7490 RepID=A0A6H5I652_9HYME|nr:F-box only protein 28 [Trichogramma pretiosum]CAB0033402.1 unnamed protein product [Trichogramma brassicae]
MTSTEKYNIHLLELPDIVLECILSKLSYDEIAKNRIVCKTFNNLCKKLLNRGFNTMEKYHAHRLKAIKSQLPRRESERRSHPLARHSDILTAIETRISMLSMTFSKYIDLNLCCFIPGKVIDEIFKILFMIEFTKVPPRTPEILQELRDISSMAMEHFDEKILPDLRPSIRSGITGSPINYEEIVSNHSPRCSKLLPLAHASSRDILNQSLTKIYNRTKKNRNTVLCVKGQIGKLRLRLNRQSFHMRVQHVKLKEHAKKIQEQEAQLNDMRKHLQEWEQKFSDLRAEMNCSKEIVQMSDSRESCKRKFSEPAETSDSSIILPKDLRAKKRKLIVERKVSNDDQDVKFLNFITHILSDPKP